MTRMTDGRDRTSRTNQHAPYRRSAVHMDTVVSIEVVAPASASACVAAVARAFARFRHVEAGCSRFDPESELRALTSRVGEPVPVSALLFEAMRFAVAVAEASDGAFDPTVGCAMERRGFNRNYRTGQVIRTDLPDDGNAPTWRDIHLNAAARTITLARPLALDLGAVAKGMAMDLAARELGAFPHYAIEAGGDVLVHGHNARGDVLVHGHNARGEPWQIGVRHPREQDAVFAVLAISDAAVCTSGDYERHAPGAPNAEHHLLDPRTAHSPQAVSSVTVVAPTAMAADALSTAAFVLGPEAGTALLEHQGVEGLIVTTDLTAHPTHDFARYRR